MTGPYCDIQETRLALFLMTNIIQVNLSALGCQLGKIECYIILICGFMTDAIVSCQRWNNSDLEGVREGSR